MSDAGPLLDPAARSIVAHRGAAAQAPENTIPAFELALAQGADALEMDVHLSADGVPVVIHDPTLDRTTDRGGAVAALTFAELRAVDAGARFTADGGRSFPFRGKGVRVSALSEVLELSRDVPIVVEVKSPRVSGAVRDLLLRTGDAKRCVIGAMSIDSLAPFRTPPFRSGASRRELFSLAARMSIGRPPADPPYDVIFIPERYRGIPVPLRRYARFCRNLRRPVHVWTIDDPGSAKRLWRAGVSAIITNRPDAMWRARLEFDSSSARDEPSLTP